MKTATNNHIMKTAVTSKRNHRMHLLQDAGIETGAWMMSLGLFASAIWMVINII